MFSNLSKLRLSFISASASWLFNWTISFCRLVTDFYSTCSSVINSGSSGFSIISGVAQNGLVSVIEFMLCWSHVWGRQWGRPSGCPSNGGQARTWGSTWQACKRNCTCSVPKVVVLAACFLHLWYTFSVTVLDIAVSPTTKSQANCRSKNWATWATPESSIVGIYGQRC